MRDDDKVLAGISHLGILAGWIGLFVALAIYVLRKDQSQFVKRSVRQAIGYQVCALIIFAVLAILFGGSLLLGVFTARLVATGIFAVALVKTILVLLYALGIWGAIRSFQGVNFKYPLIGDFLDRL